MHTDADGSESRSINIAIRFRLAFVASRALRVMTFMRLWLHISQNENASSEMVKALLGNEVPFRFLNNIKVMEPCMEQTTHR